VPPAEAILASATAHLEPGMFNDAALALEEIPSRQDPQRGVRRPLTSNWSLLINSRSDSEPSCRCRSTRLCWLNISRPAFRRASKARINKGEALGNQRDRASGLNLTVAAVISRDTIYLGNAVASFPSKPQHRPWSVSLQTRGSCGQNSLKASRSPAAITSVC
jgi:hypothetical protein